MNVDIIRTLAKKKGLSLTKLEEILGFGNGTIGKWVKQSPSCDKLSAVADYLSVSLDFLYNGKEKSPYLELDEKEQRLLEYFKLLNPDEKIEIIGELKGMTRGRAESKNAETA